jgi:hypothetical protein
MTKPNQAAVLRRCEIAGCGRRHFARGYCRAHHERWRRHGDPQADVPVAARQRGTDGYRAVGRRLRSVRGTASGRRCAGCAAPAACWSYDGSDPDEQTDPARGYRYSLDPDRYQPRCRTCHHRQTLGQAAPRTPAPVVDIERAARLYRAGASVTGIAYVLGTSRAAVHTALRTHGVALRRPGRHNTPATEIPTELDTELVIQEHR